jgi:hypothetical protein
MGFLPIGGPAAQFPNQFAPVLEELPKSLDETYKRILKEINNANRLHAYRLLQCLMVASRPLLVEDLAEMLAFDLGYGRDPKVQQGLALGTPRRSGSISMFQFSVHNQ